MALRRPAPSPFPCTVAHVVRVLQRMRRVLKRPSRRADQTYVLNSSLIAAVTYSDHATLDLVFRNGTVYRYFAVPARVVGDCVALAYFKYDRPLYNKLRALRDDRIGHDSPMEPVSGEASSRSRAIHSALANKRAADSRARALVSTIRELWAAGFVSRRALAEELNRRAIPTARGGRWHYTTVVRMLTRLGLKTHGNPMINNGQAHKRAADARAKVLAPNL